MDPQAVEALHIVLETRSMTGAAKRLRLPKSTISRRIAALEEAVGVQLLRRSTRKVEPTEAGLAFSERSRQGLRLLEEARLIARDESGPPRGRVRITAPPDLAEDILTRPLTEIRATYPDIELELGLFPRRVDLAAEGWDLALRVASPGPESLVARLIATSDGGLYAAPVYLARKGTPRTIEDLDEHHWVELYPSTGPIPLRVVSGGRELLIARKNSMRADDMRFCRRAAEAGAGIISLDEQVVGEAVAEGRLVRLLPKVRVIGPAIYLVYSKERYPTRAAKIVREIILDAVKGCPGHPSTRGLHSKRTAPSKS